MGPLDRLEKLIARLEELHEEVSSDLDGGKSKKSVDLMQVLKSSVLEHTKKVRECLRKRDELLRSGKEHSIEGIAASAAVRRELNELQETAEKLSALYERRRTQPSSTSDVQPAETEEVREVEDILKNVEACIAQEKARVGNSAERRSNLQKSMANRLDLGTLQSKGRGGGQGMDPEMKEALLEIEERDEEMNDSLDAIAAGMQRIKGIAIDINEEAVMQNVMMDEIIAKSDAAKENLQGLNAKLNNVLKNAGGASSVDNL